MANLIVSRACDMACSYCFARQPLHIWQGEAGKSFLPMDAYEERLDFLVRSEIREARLLGGEPGLHPQFIPMLEAARKRGLRLVIFSHGWFPETVLAYLESLDPATVTVMINTNATPRRATERYSDERRFEVLRRLGRRALPGFTIHRPDFDLGPIFEWILRAGARPKVRLGLANPTLGGGNAFLHPKQYPAVGEKVARFARAANKNGIKLEFDCGFVRCMFSPADLEMLLETQSDLNWRCNPILDVDLNGNVFHCFPLANRIATPLTQDASARDLRLTLTRLAAPYHQAGIYRECSGCPFKESGSCMGGCLAMTMKRFRQAGFQISLPALP